MSRSHSYSHDSGHSRGSRRRGSSVLAVTEASFQGLQLNETAGTHHTPSYTASDPTYPRSLSSHRGELTASYLQPGYDTGNFPPAPPSETFVDPQRVFGDYRSSDAQRLDFLDPETVGLGIQPASVGSSVFPSRNMSTYSYPTDPTSSHYQAQSSYSVSRSSSMQNSPYSGGEPPRRSMSSVTGPLTLPSSALSGLSTHERVVARQRRRGLQEPRREAKVRLRRALLPSTSVAGSSMAHTGSQSTNFFAAPSASSYDVNASSGSLPYGGRASSATPSRGQYVSCSPNPYEAGSYQAGYPMPNVSQSLHPPSYTPVVPSSMPDRYGVNRRPSSTSVGPPDPNEPYRILEQPSRPQCWEHGCNGRAFSTFSNLLRHQREKSGTATKSACPRCGAEFTRTTARNGHMQHEKCKPRSG